MDLNELNEIAQKELAARKRIRIHCCTSTGCQSSGSVLIKKRLEEAVVEAGMTADIQVVSVGCMGFCGMGPMVEVRPDNRLFEKVTPDTAADVIAEIQGRRTGLQEGSLDHPFFARQMRIVRENSGEIDPDRIEEYIAVGGYRPLYHALREMSREEVVETILQSGLRGRGGAGYPTGTKWAMIAKASSDRKFVVCNGDEGDPGAFMDRSVLESDPHRVLEGMAIAAYAVGASQGYIYVRGEYPLAISRLQTAIKQARRMGLMGTQIFDSPFDFRVDIRIGAGAFVCGEETALISSIEGKRGTPRPRPPYPAEKGLWGCPTLINNVETLAAVPVIVSKGAEWFSQIGTEKSKGTKVFALTGQIANTGLIEVPMGITLREIVEEMGGGVPGGSVKAVQTGGPSGGCIPADLLDTSVDYESLVRIGSMMGSGGMVVMDQDTSMLEVARYYMEFCMDESCGKCIPCRAGTVQMHGLLTKIVNGEATEEDLERLKTLCDMVKRTSLCGLGQTAPNPVLSTLRYFPEEYHARLKKRSALFPLPQVPQAPGELKWSAGGNGQTPQPAGETKEAAHGR